MSTPKRLRCALLPFWRLMTPEKVDDGADGASDPSPLSLAWGGGTSSDSKRPVTMCVRSMSNSRMRRSDVRLMATINRAMNRKQTQDAMRWKAKNPCGTWQKRW